MFPEKGKGGVVEFTEDGDDGVGRDGLLEGGEGSAMVMAGSSMVGLSGPFVEVVRG